MNIILYDGQARQDLLPLCFTRPVSELRTGILTIREKWEQRLAGTYSWKTEAYLQTKFPMRLASDNWLIMGNVCPTKRLIEQVRLLNNGCGISYQGYPVAARLDETLLAAYLANEANVQWTEYSEPLELVQYSWDLIRINASQLQQDFDLLTANRESEPISLTNQLIHPENIFAEPGVKMEFATINATDGPVFLGRDAEVMEGSLIRGPFALGSQATVNMGSKIYGATTIGPNCKVGGEISQSILMGFSNKGHDGFLGHSVLGEWCNLGAGTNVSNLKNSYEQIRIWNYRSQRFMKTGLQFGGVIMGDHSKAGINAMFNTGTVVGVGCNIHGSGFPRQFVPSFADGGPGGFKLHPLKTVFNTAGRVMERRNKTLTRVDEEILSHVFEETAPFRRF
ncbi:GlmU family protein [uncultured Sunxiuqinia sp.]|uniref:GlmU family protein n=1 Tax=uncultured Sunxiuqinia sp. TaxID=1573825 RepID=UPI00262830BA|nr:GlmU family protein [uncultured Sunxiuqinia sp.]